MNKKSSKLKWKYYVKLYIEYLDVSELKNTEIIKSEEVINVFITDYRFPNEKAYFEKFGKVITYRIFSPYVNGLNTLDVESEHSLDNEITDYLVLRNPEDFSDAIDFLPVFAMPARFFWITKYTLLF